jgi:sulfate transport system permease protein
VLVAWVLVRYPFPGRRLVDALIDLSFALPNIACGLRVRPRRQRTRRVGGI